MAVSGASLPEEVLGLSEGDKGDFSLWWAIMAEVHRKGFLKVKMSQHVPDSKYPRRSGGYLNLVYKLNLYLLSLLEFLRCFCQGFSLGLEAPSEGDG